MNSQFLQAFIRMLHEMYHSKQTCLIDLEQTGRPMVLILLSTLMHFDLRASCANALE